MTSKELNVNSAQTDLDAATKVLAEALRQYALEGDELGPEWGPPVSVALIGDPDELAETILRNIPEGWHLTRVDALNGAGAEIQPWREVAEAVVAGRGLEALNKAQALLSKEPRP